MNGIEILNKTSLTEPTLACYISVFVFFILCSIILTLIIANTKDFKHVEDKKVKYGASVIASMLCSIFITLFYFGISTSIWVEPTGEYQYQVTIDEKVSMIDFDNKYIIIKQEGKIYTIEKR